MTTATTTITPNKHFRDHIEGSLDLILESEVRDYLNRLWLDAPDSFDVDALMPEFMDYMEEHFRMVWIYTKD